MRLFISSYRAGRHDQQLGEFIGPIDKVAVITNAKDYKTAEDRRLKIEDNFNYFRSLGLEPTEIDLRAYFHKSGAEKKLSQFKFIWLAGGNVFLLRRALKYSQIDKYLDDQARDDEVILGGESAGAIIMGPTLRYSEMEADGHEDNPNIVPEGYEKEILWEGLGFIDYVPVPHYKNPEYGHEIDSYIRKLDKHGIAYRVMSDEQTIIISDANKKFLS